MNTKTIKTSLILCPFWQTEAPPLGISYLGSYLRSKKYEVFLFDFNVDLHSKKIENVTTGWNFHMPDQKRKALFNRNTFTIDPDMNREINHWITRVMDTDSDIIGFSVYGENLEFSYELARRIKKEDPSKKIIFGGPFCRRNADYSKLSDSVDVFVVGEGEDTLVDLLESYERGGDFSLCPGAIVGGKDGGVRESIDDLDKLPFPGFHDFPLARYTRKDRVYFLSSRGCVGKCAFCRDRNMWPRIHYRSSENIFNEMKLRNEQGYSFLRFADLIINGNLNILDSLGDLIINRKLKINWDGALKSSAGMNYEFFKKLKEAGYQGGNFSVESGSQVILNNMRKGHKIEIIEQNLRDMDSAGIRVGINLIVGFPGESEETFQQTLDFLSRNRNHLFALASLTPLYVIPESDLFENYQDYHIQLGDNVEKWTSLDGKNTLKWRLEKCKQLYDFASNLGIQVECDQFKKDINTYEDII